MSKKKKKRRRRRRTKKKKEKKNSSSSSNNNNNNYNDNVTKYSDEPLSLDTTRLETLADLRGGARGHAPQNARGDI